MDWAVFEVGPRLLGTRAREEWAALRFPAEEVTA